MSGRNHGRRCGFFTATGVEVPAFTADQMREIDRIAMEETGPNLFQMMENAGRNLALLAIEFLGQDWTNSRVVVLAGEGGNGGGGICAARHLANRDIQVRLCCRTPAASDIFAQQVITREDCAVGEAGGGEVRGAVVAVPALEGHKRATKVRFRFG